MAKKPDIGSQVLVALNNLGQLQVAAVWRQLWVDRNKRCDGHVNGELAQTLGMRRDAVRKCMRILVKLGFIATQEDRGRGFNRILIRVVFGPHQLRALQGLRSRTITIDQNRTKVLDNGQSIDESRWFYDNPSDPVGTSPAPSYLVGSGDAQSVFQEPIAADPSVGSTNPHPEVGSGDVQSGMVGSGDDQVVSEGLVHGVFPYYRPRARAVTEVSSCSETILNHSPRDNTTQELGLSSSLTKNQMNKTVARSASACRRRNGRRKKPGGQFELPGTPPPISKLTPDQTATVHAVHRHWQQVLGYTWSCTPKRFDLLAKLVLAGFTLDQLKAVIDAANCDPFTQGENKSHRRFDDIMLLFKDQETVERWLAKPREGTLSAREAHRRATMSPRLSPHEPGTPLRSRRL